MSTYNNSLTVTKTSTGVQFQIGADKITQVFSTPSLPLGTTINGPSADTTTGITAFAGGGQGSAVLLTKTYNVVTVVATAADSVKLPVASVNTFFVITNSGANALAIFPASSGTLNNGTVNASISLAPGSQIILVGSSALNWNTSYPSIVYYTDSGAALHSQIVNEPASAIASACSTLITITNANGQVLFINPNRITEIVPFFTQLTGAASVTTNSITAFAGGGQASAVLLTTLYNIVTVVATAQDSVKLPVASSGASYIVMNSGANDLAIFPATSGTINNGVVNASVILPSGSQMIFTGTSVLNWATSAPVQSRLSYDNEGDGIATYYVQDFKTTLNAKIAAIINSIGSEVINAVVPATTTLTPQQLAGRLITTSSAAATSLTLPTAAAFGAFIGAGAGTIFEFVVNNFAGANTVTVVVGTGITASGFPATNTLTVPASTTVGIAVFRLQFMSQTAATLVRIG